MWSRARAALVRVHEFFDLRDAFCFGGLAAATYGTAMIYEPAAWILAGVVLFWMGVRR